MGKITRQDIENHFWEKATEYSERLALVIVTAFEFIRIKMLKGKK